MGTAIAAGATGGAGGETTAATGGPSGGRGRRDDRRTRARAGRLRLSLRRRSGRSVCHRSRGALGGRGVGVPTIVVVWRRVGRRDGTRGRIGADPSGAARLGRQRLRARGDLPRAARRRRRLRGGDRPGRGEAAREELRRGGARPAGPRLTHGSRRVHESTPRRATTEGGERAEAPQELDASPRVVGLDLGDLVDEGGHLWPACRRDLHQEVHVEITGLSALSRDALAPQAQTGPALRPLGNLEAHRPIGRRDLDLGAVVRLGDRQREIEVEVVALAPKVGVRRDVHHQHEVAGRPTRGRRRAMPGNAHSAAVRTRRPARAR